MAGKDEEGNGRPGRETKLTLVRLKRIITVLLAGNYVGTACEFAGISRSSFDYWRLRGEKEMERVHNLRGVDADVLLEEFDGTDPKLGDKGGADYMWVHRPRQFKAEEWPYVIFQFQVHKARAAAEVRALHQINSAMGDSWQAAAWFLERTRPDRYGRQQRINLEGSEPGSPVAIVSVESLEEKMKGLLGD